LPSPIPFNNKVRFTFTAPPSTDIAGAIILKDTVQVTNAPEENVTYATGTKIGTSDVVCSLTVTASTSYICDATYNIFNGTPYYFKYFTRDTYGNWSAGLNASTSSVIPNRTIILSQGSDTASTTLSPSGIATTSNTFILQTDAGIDTVQTLTITFSSGTATSTSLVEITNDGGTVVYGSTTTPQTDIITIPLSGLTLTTSPTQYRVRVTPKAHNDMPLPRGSVYYASTTVTSLTGTVLSYTGLDYASTTIAIDNLSPEIVSAGIT
jgi:hypothetical protein